MLKTDCQVILSQGSLAVSTTKLVESGGAKSRKITNRHRCYAQFWSAFIPVRTKVGTFSFGKGRKRAKARIKLVSQTFFPFSSFIICYSLHQKSFLFICTLNLIVIVAFVSFPNFILCSVVRKHCSIGYLLQISIFRFTDSNLFLLNQYEFFKHCLHCRALS